MEEKKKKKERSRAKIKFSDAIELARERMVEHNLTFEEIERSCGVEAEFCRILFDGATMTADNISKLFAFLRISIKSKKTKSFTMYLINNFDHVIRVRRKYAPQCTMYYDRIQGEFYKFSYKRKTTPDEEYTAILKNEMKDAIFAHIEKERQKN